MKKSDAKRMIDERVADLKTVIAQLKTSDTVSKKTRGTQLYARSKERRILHLLASIIDQASGESIKLAEDDMNTFVLITTLSTERAPRTQVEINEGDFLPAVLKKYADVKKVYDKIMKACEASGLELDSSTGRFVARRAVKEA